MEWTPESIRALRHHLKLTQTEFGERLGVTRVQTVSEWELGKTTPGCQTILLLDVTAREAGFTDRVAAKLREKLTGTE
ncbi:MAG TPA: helix-turn-helix transcriptional regulator [Candidatus Kapabacteria bacterium]|nr:helix-turn-helix transcriptional regulator [Candidatus Kapabacteria bacterium]